MTNSPIGPRVRNEVRRAATCSRALPPRFIALFCLIGKQPALAHRVPTLYHELAAPPASHILVLAAAFLSGVCLAADQAGAGTLEGVRVRGQLVCGVSDQVPGFAVSSRLGEWKGIEIDFCRAVASAALGDKSKVVFKPMSRALGPRSLAAGEVDLLAQTSAWTFSNDTEFKIRFVDILVFDGQGFLVPKSHGLSSVLELSGASICIVSDTRAQEKVASFFGRHRMKYRLVKNTSWRDLLAAYGAGKCTALTGDVTQLAASRRQLVSPQQHEILPEFISKEPLGPAVRTQDTNWFAILRWIRMALIEAEELGVSRSNVSTMAKSPIEDVRRLLGSGSTLGQSLGLDAEWARRMIGAVGNYGEIFDRNLGAGSDLQLERGYNKLWTNGGLMYGVPMR